MGWKSHPTALVHPDPGMLLDVSSSSRAAALVSLINHSTTSPMVCMLYEIIFGVLNIDSPSLNSMQSCLYPNITVYSCPVVYSPW